MKNKTLKTIKIRKLMVKDLLQIVKIEEAITKVKVSQQKKSFFKGPYSEGGQCQLCGRGGRAGGGVYHQRNFDQQFWFGSGRLD